MPVIFILELALQGFCVFHVIRTGRPMTWVYVIVILPVAGSLIYFFMEILPEIRHSRAARQVAGDVGRVIDPDKALRQLTGAVEDVPSVANKVALAGYYPGEEARCRYALLLQKAGQVGEAKAVFADLVRRVDKASKVYFRAQRDWYEVARRNL